MPNIPKVKHQDAMYAVIGYVPDAVANALRAGGFGKPLELRIKRGSDHQIVRVQPDQIAGVLQGASQGGETGVQVFLKENATVETFSRGLASDLHLRGISDPNIWCYQPPVVSIFAAPNNPRFGVLIEQLEQVKL